jgi:hypothetical protein
MNQRLSQSEHGTVGGPQRRVPKGKKALVNSESQGKDSGHHPDGLTQVPRVESRKTPPKHHPLANVKQIRKKNGGQQTSATKKKSIDPLGNRSSAAGAKNLAKTSSTHGEPENVPLTQTSKQNGEIANPSSTCSTDATSTDIAESSDADDGVPTEEDICFEAEEHPGTDAFFNAVRKTLNDIGPSAYSPKVYRQIKRQLPGRRFFVCDDDNKPYDWREVSKSELIDLVWKYYEDVKSQMYGVRIEEEADA